MTDAPLLPVTEAYTQAMNPWLGITALVVLIVFVIWYGSQTDWTFRPGTLP